MQLGPFAWIRRSLGSRWCTKNRISEGASRSRTPIKLQYEPRVTILQHDYDVCAAKYGMLARLVPSEIPFCAHQTSSPVAGPCGCLHWRRLRPGPLRQRHRNYLVFVKTAVDTDRRSDCSLQSRFVSFMLYLVACRQLGQQLIAHDSGAWQHNCDFCHSYIQSALHARQLLHGRRPRATTCLETS